MVHDPSSSETYRFAGPVLRRMTSEQIWDSLITLVAYNPWSFQRPTARDIAPVVDIDWSTASLAMAQTASDKYEATYAPATYNKERQTLSGFEGQLLVAQVKFRHHCPSGISCVNSDKVIANRSRAGVLLRLNQNLNHVQWPDHPHHAQKRRFGHLR